MRRLTSRYEATISTATVVKARAWNGNSGTCPLVEVDGLVDCAVVDVVEVGMEVCLVEVVDVVVDEAWLVVEVVEVPPVAEAGKSITLYRPPSATHRFPDESNAIPSGLTKLL